VNIFLKIRNSIYNPNYYTKLLEKPFSYSVKYYILFALVFALAFTVMATVQFIPAGMYLSEKVSRLSIYFPQNLVVNIKNGQAYANVKEPYFVKMPKSFIDNNIDGSLAEVKNPNMDGLENFVVIDTKNRFDIDTFRSYKTFLLLSSNNAVYINKDGQTTINSLSMIKNFTLSRQVVADFINKAEPYFIIAYPLFFIGAFIGGFFFILSVLFYLLFGALLVWFVAKIRKIKIGYKKAYQISMHLVVLPILITSIIGFIPIKLTTTFLFTVLLVLAAMLNVTRNTTIDSF
jgi:hypothetical protein